MNKQKYMPKMGDRVAGKVHKYLTHVWIGPDGTLIIPTETFCSGVIVRQMHNAMFLIKTDEGKRLACSLGYVYKPT